MKHYLELENNKNQAVFIEAGSIVAIQENPNVPKKDCIIYCSGISTPFQVNISHHDLIKKLVELGVFKLEKF